MGEQPDDNVTAVACQHTPHAQQKLKKTFSADDVLNGPLSPPNLLAHNKCVLRLAGKTHSLQNCFEVNVWQLPDAVVKKRAANEAFEYQAFSPDKQSYKWRKVHHKKMQGKELDKVEAKWEEVQLRIYEKSVMDHHQQVMERDDFLNKKREFLHKRSW